MTGKQFRLSGVFTGALLLMFCAPQLQNISKEKHAQPALVCSFPGDSLAAFAGRIAAILRDTISDVLAKTLWDSLSARVVLPEIYTDRTDLAAFFTLIAVCKSRSFCVVTPTPDTYESLRALAVVPGITFLLTARLNPAKSAQQYHPDSTESFNLLNTLSADTGLTCTRLLSIKKTETGYLLKTADGGQIAGQSNATVTGQVYCVDISGTAHKYKKVCAIIFMAALPASTLEQQIDEWYAAMPFQTIKPRLTPIIPPVLKL